MSEHSYRSIVVPVDLEDIPASQPALTVAAGLAAKSGGMLHLIYVCSDIPRSLRALLPDGDAAAMAAAEIELKALAATVSLPAAQVTARVRVGAVETRVLKEVEAQNADLIVIGAHRPETLGFLMGSNAADISRHAPCSVLVIRNNATLA